MCGIAVCVSENSEIDKKRFEAMTDVVAHRGPDDRGFYYDNGLAMGHRRLSIIDLSNDGHQPFEKVDGYVITFNGEIYNYIELREELKKSGFEFLTQTDTEVIVQAYKKWGVDCVSHFNGMWAFVIYDKKKNVLFCSRDRFGVKPFYYTEQEGFFLVASEIKQFMKVLNCPQHPNCEALLRYIIRGDTEAPPQTMIDEIYQLEPGFNLIFNLRDNSFNKKCYYSIESKNDNLMSYSDACALFKKDLEKSVRLRLRSDVPIGYFLSGGLDSSSIVCVADRIRKNGNSRYVGIEQHTISSCYEDAEYDEQEYIDAVSKVTDVTVHKVFPENGDIWDSVDRILWHMDEPTFSVSGYSQWKVCEAAKLNGLKVVLDGQGSDEQLAGYNDFYLVLFINLLKRGKFARLNNEIKAYRNISERRNKVSNYIIFLGVLRRLMTPAFLDKTIKRFYYRFLSGLPFDRTMLKCAFKDIYVYPMKNPRGFIKAYMTKELINILQNLDRKTMAFSIEARDPFLDYRLVNDLYEMPFDYKIKDGWTKSILRDSLSGIIPLSVERRKTKFAFVAPIEKWINNNRLEYRTKMELALESLEEVLDKNRILNWYDGKTNFNTNDCNLIWRIIISGRWIDIFGLRL